jgi:hypothetical protein
MKQGEVMKRLCFLAVLLAVSPVLAQEDSGKAVFFYGGEGGADETMDHQAHHLMVMGAHEGFELKTVTGAPYRAEAVTEVVQVLGDGNRIPHRTAAQVARDGEGRVRREGRLAAFGPMTPTDAPRLVFIHDPVAKAGWVLDMNDKTARKLPAPPSFKGEEGPALPHAGIKIKRKQAPEGKDARKEDLGSQTIEGVSAQGTRTTHVIPAGAMGNERPIEIVHERWYSPELQAVVMSRHSDPRMGETTYRLTGIQRGEPDRALFAVPDDFKVVECARLFHTRIHRLQP